jgi:hypothetical protein
VLQKNKYNADKPEGISQKTSYPENPHRCWFGCLVIKSEYKIFTPDFNTNTMFC